MFLRSANTATCMLAEYWIHTDCFAAMQLSQSCKHSESTDLLRKSLLPHVFAVCQYSHFILQAGTVAVLADLCIQYTVWYREVQGRICENAQRILFF